MCERQHVRVCLQFGDHANAYNKLFVLALQHHDTFGHISLGLQDAQENTSLLADAGDIGAALADDTSNLVVVNENSQLLGLRRIDGAFLVDDGLFTRYDFHFSAHGRWFVGVVCGEWVWDEWG